MMIYNFPSVLSTQDVAKNYLAEGRPLPFAIRADAQTGGRGRSGNAWVSPLGNLYASIVIPLHNVPIQNAGQYSFVTAVALMECLAGYGVTHAVNKWPNDILVEGKKIAGILLESDMGSDGFLNALIIGVGVNLVSAPEGAVSLSDMSAHSVGGSESFLSNFLTHLQSHLNSIKQNGFAPIREKWLSKAHGVETTIRVRLPNETFYGTFTGLDEEGALLVTVDGKPRKVYSGDVFFEKE